MTETKTKTQLRKANRRKDKHPNGKAASRLAIRIAAYERFLDQNKGKINPAGYHRPGSMKR